MRKRLLSDEMSITRSPGCATLARGRNHGDDPAGWGIAGANSSAGSISRLSCSSLMGTPFTVSPACYRRPGLHRARTHGRRIVSHTVYYTDRRQPKPTGPAGAKVRQLTACPWWIQSSQKVCNPLVLPGPGFHPQRGKETPAMTNSPANKRHLIPARRKRTCAALAA
jgi:hypothetical protein